MSHLLNIADQVVSVINAAPDGTFGLSFTAQRRFVPRYSGKDLASVAVDVIPLDDASSLASRSSWQHDYPIGIVIQQRMGTDEEAQAAALLTLAETIDAYLKATTLATTKHVTLMESSYPRLFDPDRIENNKTYYTVLRLTYRGWR